MDIYEFYSESDKKVDKKSNKTFNTKTHTQKTLINN